MKKRLVLALVTLFVVAGAVGVLGLPNADAQEHRLVRILGGLSTGAAELKQPITLDPPSLSVPKGTVVTWLNWSRNTECVQISFEDGKRCEDGTDAPSGFSMRSDGCYVTSWISFGGTSSLLFTEPGTFNYVVEAKTGGEVRKETGQIVVTAK
jgi:hypothetical protein